MPKTFFVSQDGADFYLSETTAVDTGPVVSAPFHVSDFDMTAARKARAWFEAIYCPTADIVPVWRHPEE